MPWNVPSLKSIRETLADNYELHHQSAGRTVDAHTRGTGHTEMVNALAALAYGLRLNQRAIANNIFVDTTDEETLIKVGGELGLVRVPPAFSVGEMVCAGTDGTTVTKGAVVKHANGTRFRVTADTTLAGATNVPITAIETGVNGNLTAGEALKFVTPLAGVDSDATVAAGGLSAGADIESISRFRERVKARRKQPPMGGKYYDYEAWAKAASVDVTRAWVSAHENQIGQIIVRFVTDDLPSPIPSAPLVAIVNDYIQTVKPVEAHVLVLAPTARELDLEFVWLNPNTPEMQAAVVAELEDLLQRETRSDSILYINKIRAAISNAPGIVDFSITLTTNIDIDVSEYAVVGTTTFPG
jgi:uncharacterized phage protein gp47/JayE